MQKDRPPCITEDSRGTEIVVGKRVAYNQSGNVVLGTIIDFGSHWTKVRPGPDDTDWWRCFFSMDVLSEDDKTKSTLNNPNSFVILP